jgi:hypothetical protein
MNNNYLGVKISKSVVEPFLEKLKDNIGEDEFNIYTQNQKNRDKDEYHITVINVSEFNRLFKDVGISEFIETIELIFKYEIDDLELLGVGSASKNDNISYFIVCNSNKLDAIRNRFNLNKHDFHITIGFNQKDVFGVPKNKVIF